MAYEERKNRRSAQSIPSGTQSPVTKGTKSPEKAITEFYLRSKSKSSEIDEKPEELCAPIIKIRPSNQYQKHTGLIVTESKSNNDSNFILKPKRLTDDSSTSESVNIYHTLNNNELDLINKVKSDQAPATKQINMKSKRRGLEEIFPNINLANEVSVSLEKIKDPNWCPASDLYDSDLEDTSSKNILTGGIDQNSRLIKQKLFTNIFENQRIDQNRLNKIVLSCRRSRSSSSYGSRLSFERRDQDFLHENQPQFGQLNILY